LTKGDLFSSFAIQVYVYMQQKLINLQSSAVDAL